MLRRLFSIFKCSNDHTHDHGKCFICGNEVDFRIERGCSLRESWCPICKGSKRNRDLAKVIIKTFLGDDTLCLASAQPYLEDFAIYEAQSTGAIHKFLSKLPKYICSEYYNEVPGGSLNKEGIRSEDIEALSFSDNTFDLIITQDVFEHVRRPDKGFKEIKRVLKYGGCHIFTIPLHESRKTMVRVKTEDKKNIFLMPPVYHEDPLNIKGSLVYTDFGEDITDYLKSLGLQTDIAEYERFYSSDEIPWIADDASYKSYISYKRKGELLKYFLYNSVVFISKKAEYKRAG
ncbi:MAG: class I SAM-dependent methyltransferase [bacterium]